MTAHTRRFLAIWVALVVFVAACGGSGDSDSDSTDAGDTSDSTAATTADTAAATTAAPTTAAPTTAAPTTAAPTTAAPTTTAAPVRGEILASFVGAVTTPYPGGTGVADGEVRVYFNNGSNGFIIAVYHGPGTANPDGLCPGNSIATTEFMYISNAPLTPGACDGFPTDVGSVRICEANVWLYETKIPNDTEGTLFGSLEAWVDGTIDGQTGQALNVAGTPVIDYNADIFDVDGMFTSDGRTEITCQPPLT